jgi:hypothetical protein
MNPITLSDMFNQAHIHINSHPGVKPFISQENPNLKFGILELKVEKIEKTKSKKHKKQLTFIKKR